MRLRSQFLLSAERRTVSALTRIRRHGIVIVALTLITLAGLSAVFLDHIADAIATRFSGELSISSLRSVFATLGGALVGATAIAFSLVMFAIQVNIERTPHGLFRRISSDKPLISYFLFTFILAILVTCAPLLTNAGTVPRVTLFVFWATTAVLLSLFLAFRRALLLINPRDQIRRLVSDSRTNMRRWKQRAARARPLIESPENGDSPSDSPFDSPLAAYWQMNPEWSNAGRLAVRESISLAKRYAATGDHDVSRDALEAVLEINGLYVETRGPTFISSNPWLDIGNPTDGFINDTLEQLRQAHHASLNAADEVHAEQIMECLQGLAIRYLAIQYSSPHLGRHHAHLATSYLVNATKACIPRGHADLVMDGTRLLGHLGSHYLACDETVSFSTITDALALFGAAGALRDEYLPATQIAMQQGAVLTLWVVAQDRADINHVALHIREAMKEIALSVIGSPDPNPLASKHDSFLGPYYSASSYRALPHALGQLLAAAGTPEAPAIQFRNLEGWSDGLHQDAKELLVRAFENGSPFALTMIQFIKSVTGSLLHASDLTDCPSYLVGKLENHARWLAWVLSWVPDTDSAVRTAEAYQMTETIFEIGRVGTHFNRTEFVTSMIELMVSWAVRGGARGQGWGTLGMALLGASCLAEACPGDDATRHLESEIEKRAAEIQGINVDVRERAANDLRGFPTESRGLGVSAIEAASASADSARLAAIVNGLAEILVPPPARES